MRKVEVDIEELISIVETKEDGHAGDYLKWLMKDKLGITKKDILNYAEYYNTSEAREQGYGEEDYESAVAWAEEW